MWYTAWGAEGESLFILDDFVRFVLAWSTTSQTIYMKHNDICQINDQTVIILLFFLPNRLFYRLEFYSRFPGQLWTCLSFWSVPIGTTFSSIAKTKASWAAICPQGTPAPPGLDRILWASWASHLYSWRFYRICSDLINNESDYLYSSLPRI